MNNTIQSIVRVGFFIILIFIAFDQREKLYKGCN
jgi:hypothetical protein